MRQVSNQMRRRHMMAATLLALIGKQTFTTSRAFQHSTLPWSKRRRNVHRLSMSMALDSRELRFYGGGGVGVTSLADSYSPTTTTTLEQQQQESTTTFMMLSDELPAERRIHQHRSMPTTHGYNSKSSPCIPLTDDEGELFELLSHVVEETEISSTLRVAGGWVRDKLLATPEFRHFPKTATITTTTSTSGESSSRLTSKFQKPQGPSMGRQGTKIIMGHDAVEHQPVDIDIALDDMLGREFADHLNHYLLNHGKKTVSVGVVLKNPEKSKHLETATMKVGSFWIDFVNLRAEEYTQDSRIPDLMRIGSPSEDAHRRDLTINALFYNINTGQVEDWTGRGFQDLKRGIVATPLAPFTTLLDDPLRVLRSIRFAARLRFTMDEALVEAAMNERVRDALNEKVSRERVGGEVDLMLRSPDPVGAMRLLINLKLVNTVFPLKRCLAANQEIDADAIFAQGLTLLSTTHDHLGDCRVNPPLWCEKTRCLSSAINGVDELSLLEDEEARRLLWYSAFLKPFLDYSRRVDQGSAKKSRRQGKKANRSVICSLLVDELKRPIRDAEAVGRIIQAADDITSLINSGCDLSATIILMSGICVNYENGDGTLSCYMQSNKINSETEDDPIWEHAMEIRLLTSKVIRRVGPLWRAALMLSLSEQLASIEHDSDYYIEGDVMNESQEECRWGIIERYDAFAAALQQLGLIGIWDQKPLINGNELRQVLPNIPKGPRFREVTDEQCDWMTTHPGAGKYALARHLQAQFPEYL